MSGRLLTKKYSQPPPIAPPSAVAAVARSQPVPDPTINHPPPREIEMPASIDPVAYSTGRMQNTKGITKRNLAADMNQGRKNPWHYVDGGVDIGDGVTDARAAIAAADADGPVELPPGTYLIGSSLTLTNPPAPVPGAVLKPASGVSVSLGGGYVAGDTQRVFDLSAGGSVVIQNQGYVTPQHFGPVSSSAQTAIQAAVDAVVAMGGGTVLCPAGEYELSGTVTIGGYGVHLNGQGSGAGAFGNKGTVFNYSGSGYAIVMGDQVNDVHYDLNVANITIVGTSSGKAGLRIGAVLSDANNTLGRCSVRNVVITDFDSTDIEHDISKTEYGDTGGGDYNGTAIIGGCGLFIRRAVNVIVENLEVRGNYIGIMEASNHMATTYTFRDCYIHVNDSHGVRLSDSVSMLFDRCIFENNGGVGLKIEPFGDLACTFPQIRDSYFELNAVSDGTHHIEVDGLVSGFTAENLNMNTAGDSTTDGIKLTDTQNFLTKNVILGNHLRKVITTNNGAIGTVTGSESSSSDYVQGLYDLGNQTTLLKSDRSYNVAKVRMDNNVPLYWKDSGGATRQVVNLDSGDNLFLDAPSAGSDVYIRAGGSNRIRMQNTLSTHSGRWKSDEVVDARNVLYHGAAGDGTTDDRSALVAVDTKEYAVLPPGEYRVASNITISKNVKCEDGACICPDNNVNVICYGKIDAGPVQIFDESNGGRIYLNPQVQDFICPEWWGAVPMPEPRDRSIGPIGTDDGTGYLNVRAVVDSTAAFKRIGNAFIGPPAYGGITGWRVAPSILLDGCYAITDEIFYHSIWFELLGKAPGYNGTGFKWCGVPATYEGLTYWNGTESTGSGAVAIVEGKAILTATSGPDFTLKDVGKKVSWTTGADSGTTVTISKFLTTTTVEVEPIAVVASGDYTFFRLANETSMFHVSGCDFAKVQRVGFYGRKTLNEDERLLAGIRLSWWPGTSVQRRHRYEDIIINDGTGYESDWREGFGSTYGVLQGGPHSGDGNNDFHQFDNIVIANVDHGIRIEQAQAVDWQINNYGFGYGNVMFSQKVDCIWYGKGWYAASDTWEGVIKLEGSISTVASINLDNFSCEHLRGHYFMYSAGCSPVATISGTFIQKTQHAQYRTISVTLDGSDYIATVSGGTAETVGVPGLSQFFFPYMEGMMLTWKTGPDAGASCIIDEVLNQYQARVTSSPGEIATGHAVLLSNMPGKAFTADAGTDVLTCAGHGKSNGDTIRFQGNDLPAPLAEGTPYYVRDVSGSTFKVESSIGGGAIDLTDAGSGSMTFVNADGLNKFHIFEGPATVGGQINFRNIQFGVSPELYQTEYQAEDPVRFIYEVGNTENNGAYSFSYTECYAPLVQSYMKDNNASGLYYGSTVDFVMMGCRSASIMKGYVSRRHLYGARDAYNMTSIASYMTDDNETLRWGSLLGGLENQIKTQPHRIESNTSSLITIEDFFKANRQYIGLVAFPWFWYSNWSGGGSALVETRFGIPGDEDAWGTHVFSSASAMKKFNMALYDTDQDLTIKAVFMSSRAGWTFSQSGTTVSGAAGAFAAGDVGKTIVWTSGADAGQTAEIASVTSSTEVEVTDSKTVAAGTIEYLKDFLASGYLLVQPSWFELGLDSSQFSTNWFAGITPETVT